MRKIVIILIVFALIASSCGYAIKKQAETTNEITSELIGNSFVVSCGSGCAMRYTAENIIQNGNSINVAFNVEIFVDEKLTDTDAESYIFTYKGNEIQKIELVGENENLLETFPPDAYLFFKEFAVNLIKNNPIVEEETTENEEFSDIETTEKEEVSGNFVTEPNWDIVKCREYQEDDGYTNIQECVFANANLQQVYDIVKKLNPNLKSELPVSNIKYPSSEEGCIEVEYQYKTENHLFIELFYNGGVSRFEIIEKKNETQSKITYSAD